MQVNPIRRWLRVLQVHDANLFKAVEIRESWNTECSDEGRRFSLFEDVLRAHYMEEYARGSVATHFQIGEVVICRDNSNRFYRVRVTAIRSDIEPNECRGESVDYGNELYFLPERVFKLTERFSRSRVPFMVKRYRIDGVAPSAAAYDSSETVTRSSFSEEAKRETKRLLTAESAQVIVEFDAKKSNHDPIPANVFITQRGDTCNLPVPLFSLNQHLLAMRLACCSTTSPLPPMPVTTQKMTPSIASEAGDVGKKAQKKMLPLINTVEQRSSPSTSLISQKGVTSSFASMTVDLGKNAQKAMLPTWNTTEQRPRGSSASRGVSRSQRFERTARSAPPDRDLAPHFANFSVNASHMALANSTVQRDIGPLLLGYQENDEPPKNEVMHRGVHRRVSFTARRGISRHFNQTGRLGYATGLHSRRGHWRPVGKGQDLSRPVPASVSRNENANMFEKRLRFDDAEIDEHTAHVIDTWYNRATTGGPLFATNPSSY